MHVLALDPATKTGVAFGSPGKSPVLFTVDFGGKGATCEDIFDRAASWFVDFLDRHPVALFVIEGVVPPFGAKGHTNHNTTMITVGIYGVFVGLARSRHISWRTVNMQ